MAADFVPDLHVLIDLPSAQIPFVQGTISAQSVGTQPVAIVPFSYHMWIVHCFSRLHKIKWPVIDMLKLAPWEILSSI